jgi:hypothetical protein
MDQSYALQRSEGHPDKKLLRYIRYTGRNPRPSKGEMTLTPLTVNLSCVESEIM